MSKEIRITKTHILEDGQVLRAGTSGRFEETFADGLINDGVAKEVKRVKSLVGIGSYMTQEEAEKLIAEAKATRAKPKEEKAKPKTKEEKTTPETKTEK